MIKNSFVQLHEVINEAVRILGTDILYQEGLKGALYDVSPEVFTPFNVVVTRSISCKIAQKITEYSKMDEADFCLKMSNLRQEFQEVNFFRPGVSNYIIDCYLYALGIITEIGNYDFDEDDSGIKAGELSFIDHNGSEYCGNFNNEKQRSGFGVAKGSQGGYYAGEWKLDMKYGHGMHIDEEHNKYAGEWRMNRKNGIGISSSYDGVKYAGEWKNGKRHGHGIVFFPNGEKIFAYFENGHISSSSENKFYLKDGSCIIGKMTEKGPEGECRHILIDGSSRIENWKEGKLI